MAAGGTVQTLQGPESCDAVGAWSQAAWRGIERLETLKRMILLSHGNSMHTDQRLRSWCKSLILFCMNDFDLQMDETRHVTIRNSL
jgi:hypothetical protein